MSSGLMYPVKFESLGRDPRGITEEDKKMIEFMDRELKKPSK